MSDVFEGAVQRSTVPFRNDIVGSFLRPTEIREARAKFEKGEISADDLKKVEDEQIKKLVEKEKQVGLKGVTDGEFRRSWWHLDFMWGLDGVKRASIAQGYKFKDEVTRGETAKPVGKIKFGEHPFLKHFTFLKDVAGDAVARQTIPSPVQFLSELERKDNAEAIKGIYASKDEMIADIVKAYKDAIKAFYKLGCRNIQLDDCTWGMFCDANYRKMLESAGVDFDKKMDEYVEINNAVIEGHPSDMAVTTHVCRGNYHSTWAASGGYEPVAKVLFGKENVDGYYLEFDTDRSGDFSPLRHLSDGKIVVLGLISSKLGELENKENIIGRIKEATKYVPINQLCLSPQCGFASTEEGNKLTEEQQWNKLKLIKEITDEIFK